MRCVYKYPLELTDEQVVRLPEGARPLHVAPQGLTIMLWAMVVPEAEAKPRKVFIRGTGHELPRGAPLAPYVGTVHDAPRQLVWHVFVEDEL